MRKTAAFLRLFTRCRYWLSFTFFIAAIPSTINAQVIREVTPQLTPEPLRGVMAGQAVNPSQSTEAGLLFYLSGENKFSADFAAGGQQLPNFIRSVKSIPDGAFGSAFECDDDQLLSYWAPGNIYAQRGTLSFFWRSRYPVGPSPFPIFRVGYADHSSWDMVWLRIDWNGAGFDAFVTDVGLARTRVSHFIDVLPKADQWTHLAISWDETEGIRFYVNGKLAEQKMASDHIYDAGLDQFGPHSRIISPYQVQSEYNFVRGGDLDELRIYDRMLSDSNIAQLSRNDIPTVIPELNRSLNNNKWRNEWWTLHGWNLPNRPPQLLPAANVVVRKVEIHDVEDVKRWNWKGNDGIRETTWPGVYNMSRIPGRYDYFVLPDWDTYSVSGETVKFKLPDEPWNHVEIWGTAWGQLTYEQEHDYDTTFGVRSQTQVKSFHDIPGTKKGGNIRFDNAIIENPIGEFGLYYIHEGKAPEGSTSETFSLIPAPGELKNKSLADVAAFINGRYPADEREKMIGIADGATNTAPVVPQNITEENLPIIHIMIPYSNRPDEGLNGIEIQLPPLPVKPTHETVFPMNIRVKDPLWPMRDLADFSFAVKPNEAHTLWIDTRDRLLPLDHALYLSIAAAGAGFTPLLLKGAKIRLVYKPKQQALPEHVADRATQVRDLYGFTVEERPTSTRLNLANRFYVDDDDLLKADPDNMVGKAYKYALSNNEEDQPDYKIPGAPAGVPQWAFLQVEYLKHLAKIINYYIDERQIANGEFGGGLSDDDDFTNLFPGTALMGIEPAKTLKSLRLMNHAFYGQETDPYYTPLRQRSLPLFTNGLATINTDLLHAYEEGMEVVGQLQLLDYGNPADINHGMEISKSIMKYATQVNSAGHRHFRSRFYGGTNMSTEDPWQWSGHYSFNVLHSAYLLSLYNGNPALQKMIVEIADGLLAHVDEKGNIYTEINFSTDKARAARTGLSNAWQVLWAAYKITGEKKYLDALPAERMDTKNEFNKEELVSRYTKRIKDLGVREVINTKGTVWIDRVVAPDTDLQADRLGGVALWRINNIYPQHFVSWKINTPDNYESMAFFVSKAGAESIDVIAYNLLQKTVGANLTVWNVKPGRWQIIQGVDSNDDQQPDQNIAESIVDLETGESITLKFPPRKNTIVKLKLVKPAATNYHQRADVGIGATDVKVNRDTVTIRVYSLGAIDAPATSLQVKDAKGNIAAVAMVPPLKAPLDLVPKWTEVKVAVPAGTDLSSGSVHLDPGKKMVQITRLNDFVKW